MSSATHDRQIPFSPLVLADRLITLAEQADAGGFRDLARSLLKLADAALDSAPPAPARPWQRNGFVDEQQRSA